MKHDKVTDFPPVMKTSSLVFEYATACVKPELRACAGDPHTASLVAMFHRTTL